MSAYYVRNLYLDNRLREPDALTMAGERIDLRHVRLPAYVFAAREDHIVPWRSAYRTTALLGGEDVTFVLGGSGHIAGAINSPAAKRRNYWTNPLVAGDPDVWLERAQSVAGSWWTHWAAWLARHAGPMKRAPARTGGGAHAPLGPAPGCYVLEKPD
jgi:polyhydroxyalkanoate synthase